MAALTPVFVGKVTKGGVLLVTEPDEYAAYLRTLAGRNVAVTVKRLSQQRSLASNRFYFGAVVAPLASHCGYDREEMHELLAMRFLRIEDCPITGQPRRKRTPKCNTDEFREYLHLCIQFAAEQGIVVRDPSRYEE